MNDFFGDRVNVAANQRQHLVLVFFLGCGRLVLWPCRSLLVGAPFPTGA